MSREIVEIVRCDRCGATEAVPVKQSPGSIGDWISLKIAPRQDAAWLDLCGDCASGLERFLRCAASVDPADVPSDIEGIARAASDDVAPIVLTTVDPRFRPTRPLTVNGFLFMPDKGEPL